MWPLWILALCAWYTYTVLWYADSFIKNHRMAKKTGLPVVYGPVANLNIFWMLLEPLVGKHISKLPFGLGSWVRYTRFMWPMHDRGRVHEEVGKTFVHVYPSGMDVRPSRRLQGSLQIVALLTLFAALHD